MSEVCKLTCASSSFISRALQISGEESQSKKYHHLPHCFLFFVFLCQKKELGVEFSSGDVQNVGKKLMSPGNPEGNLLLMHAYLESLLGPRDDSRVGSLTGSGGWPTIHSFVLSLSTPEFSYSLIYHGKSNKSTQFFCLSIFLKEAHIPSCLLLTKEK